MVFAPGYTYAEYPKGRHSLSIDKQIDAFHKSYRVWQLDIALDLAQNTDAGYAVLGILNPYVEMFARHFLGYTSDESKRKARELYSEGVKLIFPTLASDKWVYEQVGKILYESSRCAVAHIGLTGAGIHLSETQYTYPLTIHYGENKTVVLLGIHPKLWAEAISNHFEHYVEQLRNPQNRERRTAFSRCFLASF
jgi:hypothetical protein